MGETKVSEEKKNKIETEKKPEQKPEPKEPEKKPEKKPAQKQEQKLETKELIPLKLLLKWLIC